MFVRRPIFNSQPRPPLLIARSLALVFLSMAAVPAASASNEQQAPEVGEFFRANASPAKPEVAKDVEEAETGLAPIPARPASRLFDDARILTPEEGAVIIAMLAEAYARDGLDVYVVASTFVFGETIEARTHRLAEAWVEKPEGFVLLYLRGEQTMTISTPDYDEPFLSQQVLKQLYENAVREAAATDTAPQRIRVALDDMLAGTREALVEKARMDRVFNPEVLRMLAFFVPALILIAGAGWALARLFTRFDKRQDTQLVFPPIPVPQRFGAPFGGGVCAEIHFAQRQGA